MDYLSIIKFFGLKLSAATMVGLLLLLYMKQKLTDKADNKDIDILKQDLFTLKDDLIKILKEKLDASSEIMSVTVDRLESVFNAQNREIKGVVDAQITALNEHIKRLEDK